MFNNLQEIVLQDKDTHKGSKRGRFFNQQGSKMLLGFILNNIEDQVGFSCNIIDKYVFSNQVKDPASEIEKKEIIQQIMDQVSIEPD